MTPRNILSLLICGVLLAANSSAATKRAPTIGDLKGRQVEVKTDDPVDAGADRARQNYQEFLNLERGDAALRSEAMRRLGDLDLEAGEYERIETDLAQGSPLATRDAITLYTRLLASYPTYARNDAVLYQLARAYEADQQTDKALGTLDQLVARYPGSRYIDEAQFRRGEIMFSAKRWADAEGAYAKVVAMGERSDFYEQSLYKQGWSLFKRGDSDAALDSFAKLLDLKLTGPRGAEVDLEGMTRPQRELIEDTLRVSAITFSFEDDAKGVDSFLKRHGPRPYAYLLFSTLGDLYASKERWTDAANAYRAFVQRDPDHERAPQLQRQAIDAYKRGGFAALVLAGKREYVERYRLTSSFWTHRKPADAPLDVRELKINIKDLAAYYHEQAQQSKLPTDYQEAARWYREFLDSFPDDADVAATNYMLADTLFESHQYHDAATEYERTAYSYAPNDKSATAGYAALVSYDKYESELQGEAKSAWHRQGLESGLRFATTFQDHPESAAVLVRTAREFYDVKEYSKAVDVADIVLARRPPVDVDKQRTAWLVIANGRFELGEFDKAEGAYLQVQSLLENADPRRASIEERIAACVYKQGEARKAAGDDAGAVDDFLRVAKLAPGAKIRATADYDAAALLIGLKDWPKAIQVLEGFRRNFPASDLQPDVTRKLAVAYVAAGNSGAAAAEFERIASGPGATPEVQREALAQSADLYEKAGDRAKTIAMWETYLKRFPQPVEPAVEARQKLADIAKLQGAPAVRAAWLEEIIRADKAAGASRTDRTKYLAAKSSLELALPARDAFNALRLTLPLKKSIEAKKAAMQRAIGALQAADSYAIAEVSTSATFEMAELYRHLAGDLMKSERPKTLAGEELEQYDLLLEEQAFPFEEKAIDIHLVNAARAADGLYDESVRASFGALAGLKPARFGKVEEGEDLVIDVANGATAPDPARDPAGNSKPTGSVPAPAASVPLNVSVRFQEAVAAAEHGQADVALQEFAALESVAPSVSGPSLNKGILLARAGRWKDAATALEEAVKRNPASAVPLDELGIVYRQLGQFPQAQEAYGRALDLDGSAPRIHRNLGVFLDLYAQKSMDALAHYEKAQALGGGEDKQLAGWIAEIRQRLNLPRAPAPAAAPAAVPTPESPTPPATDAVPSTEKPS